MGTHPSWLGGAARELPPLAVPWLQGITAPCPAPVVSPRAFGGPQRCAQPYFRAWMPPGGQLKCAGGFLAFFLKAPSPARPGQTFLCRTMRLFKVIKTSLTAARGRRRRFCWRRSCWMGFPGLQRIWKNTKAFFLKAIFE